MGSNIWLNSQHYCIDLNGSCVEFAPWKICDDLEIRTISIQQAKDIVHIRFIEFFMPRKDNSKAISFFDYSVAEMGLTCHHFHEVCVSAQHVHVQDHLPSHLTHKNLRLHLYSSNLLTE